MRWQRQPLLKVKLDRKLEKKNKISLPEIFRPWEGEQRGCPEDVAFDQLREQVLSLRTAYPGFWSTNWLEWAS